LNIGASVLQTTSNNYEHIEADSGSVSEGSNPSPAAAKARFRAGFLLASVYRTAMNRSSSSSGYGQ
jgi:hypothetical protein